MKNIVRQKSLYNSFLEIANESAVDYFSQWTYDKPLIITLETYNKMQKIQKSLYKAICYFVAHYDEYSSVMPLSNRVIEILDLCKDKPYHPGSYRTDFVIDENNNIKLIEITSRLALNGFFVSGFFNYMAQQYAKSHSNINFIDAHTAFFDYFVKLKGEAKSFCFLKGPIRYAESKHAIPIISKAGFDVKVFTKENVADNLHLLQDALVISEFTQEEWFSLSNDVVRQIINTKLVNDPRTIFLIHDKRFFSILSNVDFLKKALSKEEFADFKNYLLPTYTPYERPDLWENARGNKDNWIVKPFAQGASTDVFAGCVTEQTEWNNLFENKKTLNMVLQPYVNQRFFNGCIKEKSYKDYASGILLNYNDHFFGPGVFRASSFPVTNKADDRKIPPLITDSIYNDSSYNYI